MESEEYRKLLFLERCQAFLGLTPELLGALSHESAALRLTRGNDVVTQGQPIEAIFVAAYGDFAVLANGTKVAECRAGELIGDHEILTNVRNAGATVRVESDYALVLEISRPKMLNFLAREAALAGQLARCFAGRYGEMQRRVAEWEGLETGLHRELDRLHRSLDTIQQVVNRSDEEKSSTIEIRYLVSVHEDRLRGVDCRDIRQGYIALQDSSEIRIRDDGANCSITGKREYGARRVEIELPLSRSLFEVLFEFAGNWIIIKRRYVFDHGGYHWRIDKFDCNTKCGGLIIAEVDINEGDKTPQLPPCITKLQDITGDSRYRNRRLAEKGPPSD